MNYECSGNIQNTEQTMKIKPVQQEHQQSRINPVEIQSNVPPGPLLSWVAQE